jgi:pyruvate/2-oxoglutarate dehydrogenase complex dihydrolipoamide dehydrogenase (E3) component
LAGAAPMHAEMARALVGNYQRLLESGGVRIRTGEEANAEAVLALEPDAVVLATGAAPYVPDLDLSGVDVVQAWDVLAGPSPRARRVVVADWGGDAAGLASAELLNAAGNDVILAVGSAAFGEGLHQYQRNVYAQRLYRAGLRIEHHVELVGTEPGRVLLRNLFAPDLETSLHANLLVLALGRVPERMLAAELARSGVEVYEAGDCMSPRSAEEAVLEGTMAARRVGRQSVAV